MGKERNVPWEEILRRRKEGETARALAEEFGVSVERRIWTPRSSRS